MLRMPTDVEWVASRIAELPTNWGLDLVRRWEARKARDYYGANVELRVTTQPFLDGRIPVDADDGTLQDMAKKLADECRLMQQGRRLFTVTEMRAKMAALCCKFGVMPPDADCTDESAISRLTCHVWWRRKLRKALGRIVEGAAILLGRVSRKRDLYVSNEGLRARQQQNVRNAETLEGTIARNELGQEFTLAELQSKSTANKRNRRNELMTRMSGFERYADEHGHSGLFITITCPSRFHRYRTLRDGKLVIDNPNYDPACTPDVGQKYLTRVWSHIRAELSRDGIKLYGLRVVEPQHDGTPHWHALLFCEAEHTSKIEAIITKHALKDTPNERGAQEHRCDFKRIDKAKGTATGYIAKYIAKNIDGEHVGLDLEGRPAVESALRVEAWAARWGIRQFQQIGGPSVSVWRELRRLGSLAANAPECVKTALKAVNKITGTSDNETKGAAWDQYCEAQGGAFCGRKARIHLWKEDPDALGRYGDAQPPRPVGVWTAEPSNDGQQASRWQARSIRHQWELMLPGRQAGVGQSPLAKVTDLCTLDLCQ